MKSEFEPREQDSEPEVLEVQFLAVYQQAAAKGVLVQYSSPYPHNHIKAHLLT